MAVKRIRAVLPLKTRNNVHAIPIRSVSSFLQTVALRFTRACNRQGQGITEMWSMTSETPGAAQAARSASSRSIQERTLPYR